jgi:hypothetical protein
VLETLLQYVHHLLCIPLTYFYYGGWLLSFQKWIGSLLNSFFSFYLCVLRNRSRHMIMLTFQCYFGLQSTEVSLTYRKLLYCLQCFVWDQHCFNFVPDPCPCLRLVLCFVTQLVYYAGYYVLFFDIEYRNIILNPSNFSSSGTAAR